MEDKETECEISVDFSKPSFTLKGTKSFIEENIESILEKIQNFVVPIIVPQTRGVEASSEKINKSIKQVEKSYYSSLGQKIDIDDYEKIKTKIKITDDEIKFLSQLDFGSQVATTANLTYMSTYLATIIVKRDIKNDELKQIC